MKYKMLTLLFAVISMSLNSQSFIGAWESYDLDNDGNKLKNVVIFADGYQASVWFNAETGAFIKTNGGSWSLNASTFSEIIEFDSENPDNVGMEVSFEVFNEGDVMGIIGEDRKWKRIDAGQPGQLQGAWLMSGRIRNGETQLRDTNRPRKTMKILSGTRFQWIAYNTETKQFMGTGGGSYTTVDGKYTENIEFFSRDNSKTGLSLKFDFELKNEDWHHSGLSSKGDPIHEIWSKRN